MFSVLSQAPGQLSHHSVSAGAAPHAWARRVLTPLSVCEFLADLDSYHWIYWIAPLCGAALAAAFFLILKHLKYETNLGPDCDDDGFTYGYQLDMRDRLERVENHLANLSTHYVPGRQVDQNKAVV